MPFRKPRHQFSLPMQPMFFKLRSELELAGPSADAGGRSTPRSSQVKPFGKHVTATRLLVLGMALSNLPPGCARKPVLLTVYDKTGITPNQFVRLLASGGDGFAAANVAYLTSVVGDPTVDTVVNCRANRSKSVVKGSCLALSCCSYTCFVWVS